MRVFVGLGIVSLLVTVAVIFFMQGQTAPPVIKAGKNANQQIQKMANIGPTGLNANQGIDLQPAMTSGQLTGIQVVSIDLANPLAAKFGLIAGDVIVSLDGLMVGKDEASDFGTAKAILMSPQPPTWKLTVMRSGVETTLSSH